MKQQLITLLLALTSLAAILSGCESADPEVKYAELTSRAAEYKSQEKFEEARISLLSAIDIKPKEATPYYELAEVVLQQQKFGEAVENYQTALNLDPTFWKARLKLAALMLASKRLEVAESHIAELLQSHPEEIEVKILHANSENTKGNRDKAREILNPLKSSHPENTAVLTSLANIDIAEGKIDEAMTLYEKVAELEPTNDGVRLALGDIYIRRGEIERGQQMIESLIQENPDNSTLRYRFAEFLLTQDQTEGALEQYKEILSREPLKHYARDRLYDMYLIRKIPEQARELTAQLKAANSTDPGVLYFEGRDLELEGKKAEALELYLKAVGGLNNFAPVFRRAGQIEVELGKPREGIEHLQQAIAIDPNDVGARIGLARDLFSKKQFAQAKQHLAVVLSRYPKQIGANVLAADIALIEGNTKAARDIYNVMIKSFPDSSLNYMKLALLEEREGNKQEAERLYREAISKNSSIGIAARRLAAILIERDGLAKTIEELERLASAATNSKDEYYLILGSLYASDPKTANYAKARESYAKALDINPSAFTAYYAMARIDTASGQIDSAIEQYKKAIELDPKSVAAKMLLGLIYESKEDFDEAIKSYSQILQQEPRFGPAANNLAWLYAEGKGGDLDKALALAKVAKEELPEVAAVADTLGWIYFKRGTPQLALPYIREAIQLEQNQRGEDSVNLEILFHLALTLEALNEKAEAKQVIDSVMKKVTDQHYQYNEMKELQQRL